ncbi:Glycosyltransferase, group 2 family protein [uncultured Desulfobacterium sp.]|uniref:Glycosyltransferase, group 2 family protein n=1 Tax=uncultured Desulfobacterium sp. TaxID=201089 RepID=A0A445MVJ7_9BACT|nr:Glycosyltransferase, group 2 family protein [uncultured Desulfobacterium sp.]
MVDVSVIIPTFNRQRMLGRAISSVLDQTFTQYEVIVVDDGSRDGTKKLVTEFGGRVRYMAHPANYGVSAARNTGIKNSNAPFIAFLDSDDYWLPKKLETQMEFFEKNPHAVACQTGETWIKNGRRVNPKKRHQKPSGDIFIPSLRLCLVSPSAVMLKRTLLEEVGLFDETLPACEDYDLWLRIGCRHPVYLIGQELMVKQGGHADQLSTAHSGMDRFRIISMVKLLGSRLLNEQQRNAVLDELKKKCGVYSAGCIKRGRIEEGRYYLDLPMKLST